MPTADNPDRAASQCRVDLLIAGGGIMGLWAAVAAARLGMTVLLAEAGRIGGAASNGLLGALMPYMPDKFDAKKQFQFEALVTLEAEVRAMEAETGLCAGYRRSGRLVPLPKPHLRAIALRHSADAEVHWRHGERKFHWHVLDAPPVEGWVETQAGAAGFVHDTLAARADPRLVTAMLAAWLRRQPKVRLIERTAVASLDPARGLAVLADGQAVSFGHCVVAAGHASFPVLSALMPPLEKPLGQPVKGQSALMKARIDPAWPPIFLNGLYIVPHEGGHAAIGSTSEERFDDAARCDGQLEGLIARAREIVPVLRDAPVVERWAGLRPKAIGRDPMVGPHPRLSRIIALTGGFKVSFSLAHLLAKAALAPIEGRAMDLPESFTLASHIAVAQTA